jgi:hypothetical protein
MNQKIDLNQFELPQEPKGEAVATIRRVSTENKNGEPIMSKFDKKPRLLVLAEADGFEVAEFYPLPVEGRVITGKLKALMEAVGVQKITELTGRSVLISKVRTQQNNLRWGIVGAAGNKGKGAAAPSSLIEEIFINLEVI